MTADINNTHFGICDEITNMTTTEIYWVYVQPADVLYIEKST